MGINEQHNPVSPEKTSKQLLAGQMRNAMTARNNGEHERAAQIYMELTRNFPDFPDAWHYLGLLNEEQGRHDLALEFLQRAEDLEPNNLAFLLNKATILRRHNRFADALVVLDRAHRISPDHGQVLVQLVRTMLAMDRGGELIAEIQRHIKRVGDNWHLWMLLGRCCEQGGEPEAAVAAFLRAEQLAPENETTPLLHKAWSIHHGLADPDRAQTAYKSVLRSAPHSPTALLGLATIAAERGEREQAEQLAREVLQLDARHYFAWGLLAGALGSRLDHTFAEELEQAAYRASEDPNAWPLHFARGFAWEKLQDYERAFAAYSLANSLRSIEKTYSREHHEILTRGIVSNLDNAFVSRSTAVGAADPGAIFICGMPRSGTTLVETILGAHPDVTAGGEMNFIHNHIQRNMRYQTNKQVDEWLSESSNEKLKELALEWAKMFKDKSKGAAHITDKMPGNFAMLGLVHVCLPGARIVHVRRDPMDTGFSCYVASFVKGNEFSYTLESIGHYYHLYTQLVSHWRNVLGPERIIEVSYEDLALHPEREIRALLTALDLEWNPNCLDFHLSRRSVHTASLFQVRQPIHTRSIGRWRHFEHHLGPLLTALNRTQPL